MTKFRYPSLKIISNILITLLVAGCIILPIPTPEHGGEGVLPESDEELVKILQSSKTTRADIILQWGPPTEQLEDERFIVYEWKRVRGYIVILTQGGSTGKPWAADHYLCLEFTPENRLKQYKSFERQHLNPWDNPHKNMLEWIKSVH